MDAQATAFHYSFKLTVKSSFLAAVLSDLCVLISGTCDSDIADDDACTLCTLNFRFQYNLNIECA